jgi:hypothetical protein
LGHDLTLVAYGKGRHQRPRNAPRALTPSRRSPGCSRGRTWTTFWFATRRPAATTSASSRRSPARLLLLLQSRERDQHVLAVIRR